MRRTIIALVAATLCLTSACADTGTHTDPPPDGTPMSRPQPSFDESVSTLNATLDALENVLHEVIPPEAWEPSGDGARIGCDEENHGRYSGPQYLAPGHYIPAQTWPQIESTLAEHGFLPASSMPLEGGSAMVQFMNDFGAMVTVSSMEATAKGRGGSTYDGKTKCHEGFTRESNR